MSAPTINPVSSPIGEPFAEMPNGENPFDQLPAELVERILDNIDEGNSRLASELACQYFNSFAAKPFEAGIKWVSSLSTQPSMKDEIDALYRSLKKRIVQLNAQFPSRDFMLKYVKFNGDLCQCSLLPDHHAEPIMQALNKRFFDDLLKSYGDQKISNMTIGNFKEKIHFMSIVFPEWNIFTIERYLRGAYKRVYINYEEHAQRTTEIEAVRQKCLNLAKDQLEEEKEKMMKLADFFEELNRDVEEGEEEARSRALHVIIDGFPQ